MKALHTLVLTAVASLGFGGCCLPPGPNTVQPPAVVIDPAPKKQKGRGPGLLEVRLNTDHLPNGVLKKLAFSIDEISKPFNKAIELKPGRHYLTFRKLHRPGYVTPPAVCVPISRDGTTKVTVTYNRARLSAASATQGTVVVYDPVIKPTTAGLGKLDVWWTPTQAALNGQAEWSLNQTAPNKPKISTTGFPTGSGGPTIYWGPLAGYIPPQPTNVSLHVWRNQTTRVIVTYGR